MIKKNLVFRNNIQRKYINQRLSQKFSKDYKKYFSEILNEINSKKTLNVLKSDYEFTTYKDNDGNTRLKLLILGGLLYEYIGMDDEVVQEVFKLPKGLHFEAESATKWILVKD